jgi:hypothetical protein
MTNKLTHGQKMYRSGRKKASLSKQVVPRLCCICNKILEYKGRNQKTCTTGVEGVKSDCQKIREQRLRQKYKKEGRRKGEYVKPIIDTNAVYGLRICLGAKCLGKKKFYSPSKFVRQCERCLRLAPDYILYKTSVY